MSWEGAVDESGARDRQRPVNTMKHSYPRRRDSLQQVQYGASQYNYESLSYTWKRPIFNAELCKRFPVSVVYFKFFNPLLASISLILGAERLKMVIFIAGSTSSSTVGS